MSTQRPLAGRQQPPQTQTKATRPPRTAASKRRTTAPVAPAADRPRTSHFARFGAEYPAVAAAYEALSAATQDAGPLDAKTRALVKLALAVGAFREGAVHSATGRARTAGCTPAEIRHAVVLATTTLGFPSTMAALRWVEDVLRPGKKRRRAPR
jgi:alkylhydroperoxidase/carboxymuconolactone decarboxylase family protein YurZ